MASSKIQAVLGAPIQDADEGIEDFFDVLTGFCSRIPPNPAT